MILLAWTALVLILGASATLAIWARGLTRARTLAVLAFLLSVPVSGMALVLTLGYPLPYYPGLTISAGDHIVLGAKLEEGVAIYLLFDGPIPRYYRLPWSTDTAQAVQDAMEQSARQGTKGARATVLPYDGSLDDRPPVISPLSQQALPPKYQGNRPQS